MFRKENFKLTLEHTHSYTIEYDDSPTPTTSTWTKTVLSYQELITAFAELVQEFNEMDDRLNAQPKTFSHDVQIIIHGNIGSKIYSRQTIKDLHSFHSFIAAIQPETAENSEQNQLRH